MSCIMGGEKFSLNLCDGLSYVSVKNRKVIQEARSLLQKGVPAHYGKENEFKLCK